MTLDQFGEKPRMRSTRVNGKRDALVGGYEAMAEGWRQREKDGEFEFSDRWLVSW